MIAKSDLPDDDEAAWIAQRIVLDAGVQAARLRRQVLAQTAVIRETAEREAELIWRQASAQAVAIREAAEREAEEMRAAILKRSAGTGEPPRRPAAKPGAPGKTKAKSRQVRAMRKVTTAFVVLSLVGVTSGAAEIKLHGLSFFLFRNTGAGAGNSRDLNENQGPGQPDAPKPHHQALAPGASHGQ